MKGGWVFLPDFSPKCINLLNIKYLYFSMRWNSEKKNQSIPAKTIEYKYYSSLWSENIETLQTEIFDCICTKHYDVDCFWNLSK